MGTTIIVAFFIIVGLVLILSLATISKGYAYKHEVDPPSEKTDKASQSVESKVEKREQ